MISRTGWLTAALLAAAILPAAGARARENGAEMISPKIVSMHTPDASSPQAVVRSIITRGMTPEQKSLAIWRYCWKNTYHWPAPLDGPRKTHELDVVFDVNKQLNVYGYAYCFAIRSLAEALYEAAGLEARSAGIGGHAVTEVYYDGKYHFLDHDQRGFSRLADGSIAELTDYRGRAAEMILRAERPSKPFFPSELRPLVPYEQKHIFAGYLLNQLNHYRQHDKYRTAHSMNLALRPGERFTRWWGNAGKWHCPPGLAGEVRSNGYVNPWKGPLDPYGKLYPQAPRNDDGSPLSFGNGLLVYRPNLGAGAADFAAGVFARTNIEAAGPGFRPARAGQPAHADFRVRLPYVIAGWPGDVTKTDDTTGAAVVSGRCVRPAAADKARVLASVDSGATWKEVWKAARVGETDFAVDFSNIVEGKYSYIVRFELAGAARIVSFGLDTACQLNAAVLPAVRSGKNRMTASFEPGPEVFEETVQYYDKASHNRLLVAMKDMKFQKGSYPTLSPSGRRGKLGHVVYKMAAPKGKRIRWAKAGGAFRSHWDVAAAPDELFRIYYAVDKPTGWKLLWEADRAPYLGHWCFETDQKIPLRRPAKAVFVKYELARSAAGGEGGKMIAARMAWGCAPERWRVPRGGVRVVHVWKEKGLEKSLSRVVKRSRSRYSFNVGAKKVENVSITMQLAARPPVQDGPHPLMLKPPRVKRRYLADKKLVSAMRKALVRLDKSPNAKTAAEIMWKCPQGWTKNAVVAALMTFGEEGLAELRKARGKRGWAENCYLEMLTYAGPVKELAARLKKSGAKHRAQAARLLTLKGDKAAVPALRAALAKEKDRGALAAEAAALVSLAGAEAAPEAEKVMARCTVRGRIAVAGALAAAGVERGVKELAAALKDGNQYVRCEAAVALAASGNPDAEKPLLVALRDKSRWTRREAIVGLAAVGGRESLRPLAGVARRDKLVDLRGEARWALVKVKKRLAAARRRR